MRKVVLVHISSSGCCNTLVTMLNNGDFWLSILFHSRVFHPCRLVPRFPLPRFQRPPRSVDHVKTAWSVGIALTSLISISSHFHVAIPIQITVPMEFTWENGKPESTSLRCLPLFKRKKTNANDINLELGIGLGIK